MAVHTKTLKHAERKDRRHAQMRAEIIAAARDAVQAQGADRLTLDSVALRVGLTKQAFYYYFKSRNTLVFELILSELTRAAQRVSNAVASADTGADALEELIRGLFAAYADRLPIFRLCHTQSPALESSRAAGARQLEALRAIDDLLLGAATTALRRGPRGLTRTPKEARRLAFVAYTSVVGVLTSRAMAAASAEPPAHSEADLVETLVRTYRAAADARDT